MKNSLTLRTERLAELSTDELHRVNGAARTLLECIVVGNIPTLHGCTTAIICP